MIGTTHQRQGDTVQPAIVEALACPHDHHALAEEARVLRCRAGHRFDLARQGHATLIRRPLTHTGDPNELIERRLRVHAAGLLDPLHDAVVAAVGSAAQVPDPRAEAGVEDHLRAARATADPLPTGIVCDVGSGPGTYLAAVLDALPARAGLGIDVSRAAARRAARAHNRADAVVADVWDGLPVSTGAVALLLNVFAPRNLREFARLLAPGGQLLVMTPGVAHLAELRRALGLLGIEQAKPQRLAAHLGRLPGLFVPMGSRRVTAARRVTPTEAADLAGMGASGYHLDADTLDQRSRQLAEHTTLTLDVTVQRLVRTSAAVPA